MSKAFSYQKVDVRHLVQAAILNACWADESKAGTDESVNVKQVLMSLP